MHIFRHVGPPARILFVGDPHGDMDGITETVKHSGAQHVILLGDLECSFSTLQRLGKRLRESRAALWWIYGNHDKVRRKSHHCLHGKVVIMAGLRVGGINMPADARSSQWEDPAILRAYSQQPLDILVSHDRPLLADGSGSAIVAQLATKTGARLVVYGHYLTTELTPRWVAHQCFGCGLPAVMYVPLHHPPQVCITRWAKRGIVESIVTQWPRYWQVSILQEFENMLGRTVQCLSLNAPHWTGIIDEQGRCWQSL